MTIKELMNILKENNIDFDCTVECDMAWDLNSY